MTSLVLVKHSAPEIVTSMPAAEWHLSSAGRARCASLADRLRGFSARTIATSVEAKAVETATLVGAQLGLPIEIIQGLHEHDRRNVTLLDEDAFRATIRSLFAQPDVPVFGQETATAALGRFGRAIGALLAARDRAEDIVVVTHGTVMSLFVAAHSGEDGFALWDRLGLPSLVVLTRSGRGQGLELRRVEAAIPSPD